VFSRFSNTDFRNVSQLEFVTSDRQLGVQVRNLRTHSPAHHCKNCGIRHPDPFHPGDVLATVRTYNANTSDSATSAATR